MENGNIKMENAKLMPKSKLQMPNRTLNPNDQNILFNILISVIDFCQWM